MLRVKGATLSLLLLVFVVDAATAPRPSHVNCTERFATQLVDNFGWSNATFQQRYFIFDEWHKPGGPILFFTGGEADVELFVNHIGWGWVHGAQLGALLVWAEHRGFGKSLLCPGNYKQCGDHLSTYQALADFAALILALKVEANATTVVAYGGSYSGMLAAWIRLWYPAVVNASLAASAPVGCIDRTYNGSSYWRVVTQDTTVAAGAAAGCTNAIHAMVTAVVGTLDGHAVQRDLRLCTTPETEEDWQAFRLWLLGAFDIAGMGNYPMASSFMAGYELPAWPMRAVCAAAVGSASTLLDVVNVIRNTSSAPKVCHDYNAALSPSWQTWLYFVCTEAIIHESPLFTPVGPPNDMFWFEAPFTPARMDAWCLRHFGKKPRRGPLSAAFGTAASQRASNVFYSTGTFDPWGTGVIGLRNDSARNVVVATIQDGAHHLDLMWPSGDDPQSVVDVRAAEVHWIRELLGGK